MGTAGAKGKRDALTMVVMSKSQHRISLLRPKSQQGASPGPKTTSQLLTYSQISKSLAPTFYTPKETLYDDFGAWTSNETLSSFGATIETKHSKLNLAKSSSRRSTREESTTTPHPPSGAPRRYKSATNINHQSSSQSSETPKPSISESTVFNEKYHLDPAKKHLSFGQAVKKITTSHEFHHFDDYTNHMSHYRTTVTQRINQKFNEYHATGLQPRSDSAYFTCSAAREQTPVGLGSNVGQNYPVAVGKVFFCERGDTPISFGAKGESLLHHPKEPSAADRSTPSELGPSIKDFEQGRAASKNQIKTKYGVEGIGDRLLKRHARNKPPPQHAPGHAAQLVGLVCSAINPRSLLPALPRNKSI